MSYKSTRIYDFKLLDRLIDYDTLVDNAIAALGEFGQKNYIDGFMGCTLELLYPDLKLVEDSKGDGLTVSRGSRRRCTHGSVMLIGQSRTSGLTCSMCLILPTVHFLTG